MTLTDFLLARIADDEAVACVSIGKDWEAVTDDHGRKGIDHSVWTGTVVDGRYVAEVVLSASSAEHIARHDPARVLAECEAKRRIVEEYAAAVARQERNSEKHTEASRRLDHEAIPQLRSHGWELGGQVVALMQALRLLALPYADHPDYDEEWKP